MRTLLVATALLTSVVLIGCAAKFQPANPVAFGKNWELMGINANDYSQCFYDPQKTIVSGRVVTSEVRTVDKLGYETVGQVEVNCPSNQVRFLSPAKYDKNYRFVGREPGGTPWILIPAGSVISVLVQRYCP